MIKHSKGTYVGELLNRDGKNEIDMWENPARAELDRCEWTVLLPPER
jgi:hypothetical protein